MSAEHRPIIGDRSGAPEKPFIALCSCGWAGHVQATRPLAEREHDDHIITAHRIEMEANS